MAGTWTFDGLSLNDGTTYQVLYASQPYRVAPMRRQMLAHAQVARGTLLDRPPGVLAQDLTVLVFGALSGGTMETNRDTLLKTLLRPNKVLVSSFLDTRRGTATVTRVEPRPPLRRGLVFDIHFELDDGYYEVAAPSGTVQTGALSTFVPFGFETGNAYGYRLSLTPGGTAPAPVRVLITAQSGSVTPTRVSLRNPYTSPAETLTVAAGPTAGQCMLWDWRTQEVWIASLTNVVAWYPLEQGAISAIDFSSASKDMQAVGGISYAQDGPVDGCCDFDGTTAYFQRADAAFDGTGTFTAVCWVNADVLGTFLGAMGKSGYAPGPNLNQGWQLWKRDTNLFGAVFGLGAGSTITLTGTTTVVAGRWYHLALVRDSVANTTRLYVNGVLEAEDKTTFTVQASVNNFQIGSIVHLSDNNQRFWDGKIDEPAFLNVALTATQIRAVMWQSLPAYNGTKQNSLGVWPPLHGESPDSTNTYEIRLTHATTAPTIIAALSWRSRYS